MVDASRRPREFKPAVPVRELGTIETPIVLTNTLAVGTAVGAGTVAFGWKGGIGTSSRRLPARFGEHTLGVGRTVEAIPVDRVREILVMYGRGPAPTSAAPGSASPPP